jgi:hypothetical protein
MVKRAKPKVERGSPTPLNPPPGGAVVRMYRIGHGDCFLVAFAGKEANKPAYVLIDCGYKPGSPGKLAHPNTVKDIGADIIATTGGFVDVAVLTHEHQDHVNGFTAKNFPELKVGEVWFAWTEDPRDAVANELRKKFKDRLLGLIDAREQLHNLALDETAERIADFLELELGDDAGSFGGTGMGVAGKDPASSANKLAMKFLRDCSEGDPVYLLPHGKPVPIAGAASARAFALGPPHDMDKIDDLDPEPAESFGDDDHPQALAAPGGAARPARGSSFPRGYVIPLEGVFDHPEFGTFFTARFGNANAPVADAPDGANVPDNPAWRRIGADMAQDAEALALAMNNATNNSSLVLAFELSKGGKVLLFAGDAQAGNWRSWSDDAFADGRAEVTAKDLLGRTVLYKVGHHGSHNATLKGELKSEHANLAWMAQGEYRREFVAMITAVEKWAHQKPKPDWNHPFPPIKDALEQIAGGRVLQTDCDLQDDPPPAAQPSEWRAFQKRLKQTPLYFDLMFEG